MQVRYAEEQVCVAETMSWLHDCWIRTDSKYTGAPLAPNPFYARNVKLTPDVVDQVIADMEGIFKTEIEKYPGYHRTAQGIAAHQYLVVPGFDKLPYPQRLAIVQGVDRIFQAHRITEADIAEKEAKATEAERTRSANLASNPHYYDYENDQWGMYS